MRRIFKSFLVLIMLSCNLVFAADYRVLVISDNIANRPCLDAFIYEESAEFFANQIINRLNLLNTIESPTISEVREKLARNPRLNIATRDLMQRFKKEYNINYMTLKKLSAMFGTNKVLLITTTADSQNYFMRRTFWDFLNIPGAITIDPAIKLSTYAVLIDTDRDTNIWEDTFYKTISSCEARMLANQMGPQTQQLEKIRDYSRMLAPQVAHHVQANVVPASLITRASAINYGPKDFDNVFTKKYRWYKHGAKELIRDTDEKYTDHIISQREKGREPLSDKFRRWKSELKQKNEQIKINRAEQSRLKKEQKQLEKENQKEKYIQNVSDTKIAPIPKEEQKQEIKETNIIEIKDVPSIEQPKKVEEKVKEQSEEIKILNISKEEHAETETLNTIPEPKIKYSQPIQRPIPNIKNTTINDI